MARLDGLQATQVDVFSKSAWLLDYLLSKPEANQQLVNSLWIKLMIAVRDWKPDVTNHDKLVVVGSVFMTVRTILALHTKNIYCEVICELLGNTLERELKDFDKKELNEFQNGLIELSPMLRDWLIEYEDADRWLSDQIVEALDENHKDGNEENFKPSGKTFSKTSLLTDQLIDVIGQRLTKANKLNATPDDFRKLFSGIDQQFDMTWQGCEGELRDLFKMFIDGEYCTPKRGYQIILKSHFLDENGHRFKNLHGAKSIDGFKPIIEDCSFLLQHLTDNMTEIMKSIVKDNRAALEEAGYFDHLQAAKQSGMTIRNKRR